ncbi:YaaR family protein [Caldibacillus lycopersici]|uniref:YaaR family protein n=1 Tax=Perspicuibacillus lycopersici TaxID=1325689 RepID=A0AAE3LS23_9BACI|nr:YaaR family protein [Perspicuibacillus lycopersici]MCU9615309.1 YaaR family protein [Perspicuibacillus lycopersici]
MKVNQDYPVKMKQLHQEVKVPSKGNVNFQEIVKNQNEKLQMGQLQQLLVELEKAGDRLARSKNFRDLAKYRGLVQSFLKETIDYGLEMQSNQSWNQFGQNRILKIVQTIDEKLVQLADELLASQEKNMKILALLGEIKGLLINLYT